MDDKYYKPGSFYRIDDRTGFKRRAERTRKEWTGLIVDRTVWEIRHPQDFVKGVIDDQTVPDPRSRQIDVFIGFLTTTTTADALPSGGQPGFQLNGFQANGFQVSANTVVNVVSSVRMFIGDSMRIMLDNGEFFSCTIASVPSLTSIQVTPSLPSKASAGALVEDLTANSVANIG